MSFKVINNPDFAAKTGFTNAQFKKLDGLYLRAAADKALTYRTVECDFEAQEARYTYYKSQGRAPFLQFLIRRIGPQDMMYEVYKRGAGRIAKSGVFEKACARLRSEIEALLDD